MFSSEYLDYVESQLNEHGLDFETMIEDLGDAVNESLKNVKTGNFSSFLSFLSCIGFTHSLYSIAEDLP